MSLLDDLKDAHSKSPLNRSCPLCELIQTTEDDETREFLLRAAAGSIGRDSLCAVLRKNKTGIGHRTVERHRNERHEP